MPESCIHLITFNLATPLTISIKMDRTLYRPNPSLKTDSTIT